MENAVDKVLNDGLRTADILGASGKTPLTTTEMTGAVIERL